MTVRGTLKDEGGTLKEIASRRRRNYVQGFQSCAEASKLLAVRNGVWFNAGVEGNSRAIPNASRPDTGEENISCANMLHEGPGIFNSVGRHVDVF